MAYLGVGLNFRYNPRFQNMETYGEIVRNYARKSTFDVDGVTDDVKACRQSVPSIFMFK